MTISYKSRVSNVPSIHGPKLGVASCLPGASVLELTAYANADEELILFPKSKLLHCLVRFGDQRSLRFSVTNDKMMCMVVEHDLFLMSAFTNCLPALMEHVKSKISNLLPDCFALVFEDCFPSMTQSPRFFIRFLVSLQKVLLFCLLAFSLFRARSSCGGDENIRFSIYVPRMYENT